MLRTLHGYLLRELTRTMLLALVAFALLMTVFAIIEPLRKQGLATNQVIELIIYTIPAMFSFTLPFASLFATSMVYGRFAQDREALACRASGIGSLTILQPALLLGVVVTIVTLLLTNFVSPRMLKSGEQAVVRNIKRIAYHKIKQEGFVELDKMIIHASHVDSDQDLLMGVMAGRRESARFDPILKRSIPVYRYVVASSARLQIDKDVDTGTYFASVYVTDPAGPISSIPGISADAGGFPLQGIEIPSQSEDKAAFYDWEKLIATMKDPTLHGEIRRRIEEFRRDARHARLARSIVETINAGRGYTELASAGNALAISAPRARLQGDTIELLDPKTQDDIEAQPVVVRIQEGGRVLTFRGHEGKIIIDWNELAGSSITVELLGNVSVPAESVTGERPRKASWKRGEIQLPADPEISDAPLRELYEHPEHYTSSQKLLAEMDLLRKTRPVKIRGEIIAEMNSRIAFGLSCVFLVALGAALGLIFRGGEVLVAFAVAVAPAAVIFVLILMGKKVIANPASSDLGGMVMIWGGLVAMAAGDAYLYYRLSKR